MVASLFFLEEGRLPVKKLSTINVLGNKVDCFIAGSSIHSLQRVYRGEDELDSVIVFISPMMVNDCVYKVNMYLPDNYLAKYLKIITSEPISDRRRPIPLILSKEHIIDYDVYVYSQKWSLHMNENWEGEK